MTILTRFWTTRVTKTARIYAGRAGVDYNTWRASVEAFEALAFEQSPTTRHDVDAIVCTGGRLFRQKSSRPLYLLHYRNIFAVVRNDLDAATRGTLLLCAVLPRDPATYEPMRLRAIVADVIAEVKREDTVKA